MHRPDWRESHHDSTSRKMVTMSLVRLPALDLVKGFVAVGRRMSSTQAAEELCVTQSAPSKQIRNLEEAIGVRLFHRGHRSVTFTPDGERPFKTGGNASKSAQIRTSARGCRGEYGCFVSISAANDCYPG